MNWQDIGIRAAKTFAQAFLAVIIAANVVSIGDVTIDLLDGAFVAGLAALASFLNNAVLGGLASE
jgi:hypothetical protein